MAVIQPLYFPGGRYAASTDRKLLAALLPSEADGTRVSGVIPSYYGTKSMKVAANGTNMVLTIQPGICVIPDKATQSADSPGVYLGAIESSSESITIETNTTASVRTDSIYAVVDDTPYTITNKELSSNVAIITTSTAHGFVGGQTVVVTGVDNTFDGSYVILTDAPNAPTTYTFRYTKTATNVASTAVVANATANDATTPGTVLTATITKKKLLSNLATITTSAAHLLVVGSIVTVRGVDSVFDGSYEVATITTSSPFTFTYVKVGRDVAETTISSSYNGSAVARVPFAIKIEKESGTTLGSKTKILLAKVAVPGSSASSIPIANVSDYRQYVTGLGGVHLYDTNSSATGPTGVDGRLRWQTNSTGPTGGVRKLEVYDGADSSWVSLYDTADNSNNAWEAFTPTWIATTTNPTLGNGTLTGAYIQIGKTVHYRIRLRFGSTTSRGTGSYRFTLPVPAIAIFTGGGDYMGHAMIYDNSTADRYARSLYTYDASTIGFASEVSSSVTESSPALWAVNDGFSISGTYEAA